ncbi:unnamed protein product [Kluyveromyces dobzhanskii CBS 2104]|uniref:DNA repair and recombination protein RAD52 n=1 Tax=Kluyveromyces dobzhanskii CBS 2104 TaxID=1427455 RepID=A0A0A8L1L0_9SACH|nr:unnamed protein product [Kluyveromyces dobzhanskii CBS 2104]
MEECGGNKSGKDDIQTKLDKKLGPEYISKRVGFGSSRVAYIEGWKAINLANQIFGYNGWSTEVKNVTIDFLDERQGKFSVGCTAIVRVSLADGTYREDIGYGTVENERRKSSAFERAKKSAVTDALKRCLRGFGNALGNCLYDKDFLAKIDKVKFDPPDFDEGNLFRPADELSEMSRSNTVADAHADGPSLKKRILINENRNTTVTTPVQQQYRPNKQKPQTGNDLPNEVEINNEETNQQDADDLLDDSFMFSDEIQDDDSLNMNTAANNRNSTNSTATLTTTISDEINGIASPVTFVTAKAATSLQNKNPIPPASMFDPKFQAHSIRHTVDQSISTPVRSTVLKDKGMNNNRSSIYSKFPPKGKELSNTSTNSDPQVAVPLSNLADGTKTTPTRSNIPDAESLPNPQLQGPHRTQLGKPRMLQQPNRRNFS